MPEELKTAAEIPATPAPAPPKAGKKPVSPQRARLNRLLSRIGTAIVAVILIMLAFFKFFPGYDILLVRSDSMVPFFSSGDMIVIGPVDGPISPPLEPGTVTTFKQRRGSVTHRIIAIDGEKIKTKGDALEDADPDTITRAEIEGVYLFKIPYIGYLNAFVHTRLGWWLVILVPGGIFILAIIVMIFKEIMKPEPAKEPGKKPPPPEKPGRKREVPPNSNQK